MGRINLLDIDTSNKIAAGEVVERPSSVVKELVENSIDANASNITIEIEEGGSALIRIIDDGDGIYEEDVEKAFMPHATSKIKNANDIYSISTLGFRGEALPSIAAVSKVDVKTKTEGKDYGKELIIEGGKNTDFKDCGCNKGTTIEVRNIFFNVPARKKFLKSTAREGAIIADIINRIAIANSNISFKFYNSGKKVLQTYGNGNLKDVLRTVYGKTISNSLLYFENATDAYTIYGYIGKEDIARGSRNNQSIFVNNRYIKNKTIVAAVENAFKSFSTVNKFPFFTLFIEVYPELVDVNIHPTKAEVKFENERLLFKLIFDAVHKALKKDVFDSFSLPEEKTHTSYEEEKVEPIKLNIEPLIKEEVKYNNYTTNIPQKPKREEVTLPIDLKNNSYREEKNKLTEEFNKEDFSNKEETLKENNENSFKENYNVEIEKPKAKFPPIRIIGQFNKTYILGEYEEVLYLIDQHAAHEKILFEEYLKRIEEGDLIVQPLLVPTIIDLSSEDYVTYIENKDIFKGAGFLLEEFGGNTLSLKEVPYFLGKLEPKGLFLSIIDNLKSLGTGKTTEIKYNKIATMACKAAVKAKDALSDMEMVKLVEKLRYIDDPFHCPHGRPTIIKFTNYELEKKFRRIV